MSNAIEPLPAATLAREEVAHREVGNTAVTPSVARTLVACFLTAITVVPVVEWVGVASRGAANTAWSHLARIPADVRSALQETVGGSLWRQIVSANRQVLAGLSGFERALDDESMLGSTLRPSAQSVTTGWLGAGNERVYVGLDGWLFYRPDVEYVTGRAFLDPTQLKRRSAAASEWEALPQPDPRQAITRFARDLEARGILLVAMPTPVKPGVHPEMLARRYTEGASVLQNPSYAEMVEHLRRAGVLVFDPSDALSAAREGGPQYFATDTHWRPETMEMVAELLAAFIAARMPLPATADPEHRLERIEVRNTGDIARMLDLPRDSRLFPPETAWLRRVLQRDGSPWRSSRDADVLLLGDSFSNIYALESMGWGSSAGFAEQLSYTLRRPLDRLVQNDDGAFATRAMLQRDLERLRGKRVIVYQFAARELAFGDWKIIPLANDGG